MNMDEVLGAVEGCMNDLDVAGHPVRTDCGGGDQVHDARRTVM